MPPVSLTKFIDFVCKSGTPKLTEVKNWKRRPGYTPAGDFYKRFREGVVDMHERNLPLSSLNGVLRGLTHAVKKEHYPEIVAGYRKWLCKKQAVWFPPIVAGWQFQSLEVTVNPEVGLTLDGAPHLIKLYMKSEPLKANRVNLITNLMTLACGPGAPADCVMGILDVRRSRLFTPPTPDPLFTAQLQGEAAYWCQVWDSV